MRKDAWKQAAAWAHFILFILVFVDGVAAFGYFSWLWSHGVNVAGGEMTAPIVDHGRTVYVRPDQQALYHSLLGAMLIGIPAMFVLTVVLAKLKVPLFGETAEAEPAPRASEAVRAEMGRRRWKALGTVLAFPLGFVIILGTLGKMLHPYVLLALLVALGLTLSSLHGQVWRCPQCNAQLGRSATPEACGACGAPLG